MRQVNLADQPLIGTGSGQVEKLTGHLHARMEELIEDGLTVSCQVHKDAGRILISFPNQDSRKALRQLAAYGILAAEEENQILFIVTERVSHEDMDYVQGAVMEMLYG